MARSAKGSTDLAPFRSSIRKGWVRVTCSKPASCSPAKVLRPSVYTVEPAITFCFRKARSVVFLKIRDQSHPSTPCYPATFLHGHQDQRGFPPLQLPACPQSGLSTANPSLVDFHFAAQRLAFQVDHSPAELVKQHPCCLIASQTKLALQKKRRDPAFIGGHQVGSPKPDRQRHLCVMKNGLCGHRNLLLTTGTLPAAQI